MSIQARKRRYGDHDIHPLVTRMARSSPSAALIDRIKLPDILRHLYGFLNARDQAQISCMTRSDRQAWSYAMCHLDLTHMRLDKEQLQELLSRSPHLQSLHLNFHPTMTEKTLHYFRPLPLNYLSLSGFQTLWWTDETGQQVGIQNIRELSHLQTLRLSRCDLVTKDFIAIGMIPKLHTLMYFSDTSDQDDYNFKAHFKALVESPTLKLKHLELAYSKIHNASLSILAQFPLLESLNLIGCKNITDTGLPSLATCPQLETLNLSCCVNFGNAGFVSLAKLASLKMVDLSYTYIGQQEIAEFKRIRRDLGLPDVTFKMDDKKK